MKSVKRSSFIIIPVLAVLVLLGPPMLSGQTTMQIESQIGEAWQTSNSSFSAGPDREVTHFGFGIELFQQLGRRLSVGVAPGFMRRGTSFETGFLNGLFFGARFEARLYLNYIQLPFYLKANFPIYGKLECFGQTGVGYAYLVGGFREATVITSVAPTERLKLDFEERDAELNRFDLGWHSSLGLKLALGKGKLALTYNYYLGFLDVDQKNESKNRNWGVGLGYQFLLRKNKD
ncbi:MAG: outer membrane beta-barrel protein [Bacteroidota bacterium]